MKFALRNWMAITAVLALVLSVSFGSQESTNGIGASCACLPFLNVQPRRIFDRFDENGGGGGDGGSATLPEKEFQKKVLGGIQKTKEQYDDIEKKITEIDDESKKLTEDFAKQVKDFYGLPSQVNDMTLQMKKLQMKVATSKQQAYGSPLQTIQNDEEMKNAVNGIIRGTLKSGNSGIALNDDQQKAFESYQEKSVSTGAAPGQDYLQDRLHTELYSLIANYGLWRMFDVIPASTKTTKLLVDDTDPEMLFVGEGIAPNEAAYTGSMVSAGIKKILGWISVTTEALEDSEIDLSGLILPKFANATAKRMDYMAIAANGTNDGANGAFTGLFTGGTAAVAEAGLLAVKNLTVDDFIKVLLAVDPTVLEQPGCCWTMNPQQLVRAIGVKDGNGRSIFLPATDAPSLSAIGSILGYPVKLSHVAPNAEGANAKIATFGDPKGMAVMLRKDLDIATSAEAKFMEDMVVFRGRARAAAKLKKASSNAVLTLPAA